MGMEKKVQAKHVPEGPIFRHLLGRYPAWSMCLTPDEEYEGPSGPFFYHMDELRPYPWKVMQAKMRALMNRGLVDGCDCGCRGDYVLTEDGLKHAKAFLNDE